MKIVRTKDVPWGEGMQRGSYFQGRKHPDSGKVHAVVGAAPNLKSLVFRQKDAVGYFDGEPDAE